MAKKILKIALTETLRSLPVGESVILKVAGHDADTDLPSLRSTRARLSNAAEYSITTTDNGLRAIVTRHAV